MQSGCKIFKVLLRVEIGGRGPHSGRSCGVPGNDALAPQRLRYLGRTPIGHLECDDASRIVSRSRRNDMDAGYIGEYAVRLRNDTPARAV